MFRGHGDNLSAQFRIFDAASIYLNEIGIVSVDQPCRAYRTIVAVACRHGDIPALDGSGRRELGGQGLVDWEPGSPDDIAFGRHRLLLVLGAKEQAPNFGFDRVKRFLALALGVQNLATAAQGVIAQKKIRSIAIPPLGSRNGGLNWPDVRSKIETTLGVLNDVNVIIYEPTDQYQNVSKRAGVEKLTPARALVAELVRRYWILGIECSLLEIQKLAYFLERSIENLGPDNPLDLRFQADKYGPYAPRLTHLLNGLAFAAIC
jgi:hypothetical protein